MGRGVRVLLLLGLLHWAGGGEGRKTWRRRGQQPPPPPPPPRAEAATAAGQPVESFPLDFTAVEGNMDSFMAQVKSLAQSLYPCSAQQLNEDLRLHLLLNTSVTCNDGSSAGYYLKESKGSRRWLLFLEGGWYCFNRENCDSRYDTMRRLMSSKDWPLTRTGTGILSSQPEENPHWWNANMVFIPYCSSDVWSGASSKSEKNEYAFMGALIIQEVVRELLGKGLSGAKVLLLAGSSAGGTGVLLNVDRVAEQLEELGYPAIQVRGLADSGWFLDNKQYRRTDCIDTITCAPTEAIRRGIRASFAPACLSHEIIIRSHWTDVQVKGTSLPRALHCWDRSLHDSHKASKAPLKGCPIHLVDSCPWPHCNPSCPTIRDQYTGQEMNVAQFLMHIGFDVQTVAQQQGLEPSKLLGMLSSGS
ncbi:palmitoleoyl-protein carboxylesterase NOTUM isoform X2 [Tursiops truncatus]|uniref:palmitoleoyl-protein carboxylesterase NOTUM isoform X2 n=1 Tax=Tursiops truncatus TaxID=9739 RepID=UPI003CCF1353